MILTDREVAWNNYHRDWGGWIDRWLSEEEIYKLKDRIPPSWIELVINPCAESIQDIWSENASHLPLFVNYLSHSILEARIAESQLGYLLVYFLKDWQELGLDEYEDGFMMSGLPTPESLIVQFESEVGALPTSLRSLWLTHGFIQCHSDTFIASLQIQQQALAHAPKIYLEKKDRWQEDRVLDGLAIADVIGEIVPSLSRQVGSLSWDDHIIDVMKWSDSIGRSLHVHVDNLLADWRLREWKFIGKINNI